MSEVGLGSCRPSNSSSTRCSIIVAGVPPLEPFIYKNLIFWEDCSSQNKSYFSKRISRAKYLYWPKTHMSGADLAKIRLVVCKTWTLELKIAKHCVFLITIIQSHVKGTSMGNGVFTKLWKTPLFDTHYCFVKI